jgi:hypothetical protein
LSEFSARVYRFIFALAAAYNIAFGLWTVVAPNSFFRLFDLELPRYPAIWSCLGMVVGLYGVGYAYASRRLDRAFPFIAIGLAGKILGPIGWVLAVRNGEWSGRTFPLIVFNDLIWWLPFGFFLLEGRPVSSWLRRHVHLLCAASHLAAAIGTVVLLRGGSEAEPDPTRRAAYILENPSAWRAGWILWMIAALTLAAFYARWGSRVPNRAIGFAAFLIAVPGLLCDFLGESMLISSGANRVASYLMGGAANGLYTLAGILLTVATPGVRGWLRSLTWAVWASGVALTVFTVADWPAGYVAASAVLMVLFIPWVLLFGERIR